MNHVQSFNNGTGECISLWLDDVTTFATVNVHHVHGSARCTNLKLIDGNKV